MTDHDPFASPPPGTDVATLLREGIDDARAGDRASARIKFERVVELDDRNEKGWFWLASVVDTDEERRAALDKVLEINPNNDRARKALDALEARMDAAQPPPKPAKSDEIIPGVSRRMLFTLVGIGAAIIVILGCLLVTLVTVNNNNQAAAQQAALEAGLATAGAETAVAVAATQAMVDAAATQVALATPTDARPTLPPTWTPSPAPTPTATEGMIGPPLGASGVLGAWGGADIENIGFYPVGVINLNAGTGFQRVGDSLGRDVTVYADSQRIAYTVYDRIFFATNLQALNTNGSSLQNFGEGFNSSEIIDPEMPSYSPDGLSLVFVARTPTSGDSRQVFLLSLVDSSVRNLSNDEADYSYPRVSPDGDRVLVVRDNVVTGTGVDLAVIQLDSGGKFAITTDQNTVMETQPRWSPDGQQIVYAAALATTPGNHDIYLRNADGSGTPTVLVAEAADERFPVVSPDSRFLAFASNRTGNYEIYTLDLLQQPPTLGQITSNRAEDFFPGDWGD